MPALLAFYAARFAGLLSYLLLTWLAIRQIPFGKWILLVLAALPGLAYASPPDPSWIPGLYDNADYDDVVVLVTSETASVNELK